MHLRYRTLPFIYDFRSFGLCDNCYLMTVELLSFTDENGLYLGKIKSLTSKYAISRRMFEKTLQLLCDNNWIRVDKECKTKHKYYCIHGRFSDNSSKKEVNEVSNSLKGECNLLINKNKNQNKNKNNIPPKTNPILKAPKKPQPDSYKNKAIAILNQQNNGRFNASNQNTDKLLTKLKKQGVTLEQIEQVCKFKAADEWFLENYYRPATIFSSKFFNYLEESHGFVSHKDKQEQLLQYLEDTRVEYLKNHVPFGDTVKHLFKDIPESNEDAPIMQ